MNTYTFVTEIPQGDTRRRHMRYDKSGMIDLGPLIDVIPLNNGVCPAHYGYLKNTLCAADGDEIDAILISENEFLVSTEVTVRPIGMFVREDGDQKVLVIEQNSAVKDLADISHADIQMYEQYFCYKSRCIEIVSDEKTIWSLIAKLA